MLSNSSYAAQLRQPVTLYNIRNWNVTAVDTNVYHIFTGGDAVAQLVEALRYKPEGRGFHSRWYHWNFSLPYFFRPHYGPGVDSDSNRNEYQEHFLGGVKATDA